ncbi:MAG: hypothetical protein KA397_06170 [Paludibacteraceae bacterium]|nr:hypothetical protein [Paludibacteraceae bacterium]
MKIAISSTGNSLDSAMDSRFGRCVYLAFYDTETKAVEFKKNPNETADSGAGPATAQFVAIHDVSRVLSGDFGGKVRAILDGLKIEMVTVETNNKTIAAVISTL